MQTKGELTKKRVLEAAAKIIAENGVEFATVREIARIAGVTPSLVQHYCPKKEDLFMVVIRHIYSELRPMVREQVKDLEPFEKLIAGLKFNFTTFQAHPHYYKCLMLSYYYAAIRSDFKLFQSENDEATFDRYQLILSDIAHDKSVRIKPKDMNTLTHAVIDMVEGALIYYFINRQSVSFEEYVTRHLESQRVLITAFLQMHSKVATCKSNK